MTPQQQSDTPLATQARRWNTRMRLAVIAACAVVLAASYATMVLRAPSPDKSVDSATPDATEVVSALKRQSRLSTTEVRLTKLGIYDSEKSDEPISFWKPSTIKIGRRACVVPVHITLHYGIDLAALSPADIQAQGTRVSVTLPKPGIISAERTSETPRNQVFSLTSGLRSAIGHKEINHIKDMAYQSVVDDRQLHQELSAEVKRNTVIVFSSLLRNMGFTETDIQFRD